MERTDYYILFDNFEELVDYDETLATELLDDDGTNVIEMKYGW